MAKKFVTTPRRDGLVGEWLLSGNALDSTGTNNGTATNVTYANTDRGYQKQCGVFGATSSVTSSATFTNVQTLYFRIYPTANTKTLATLVTSTSIVSINSSSQIATTGLTTVNVYVNNVATTQLVLNTWNDVVVTCDAKTFSNLNVGSSSFLGNIGRVAFFNRVLGLGEIRNWYLEGLRKLGGGSMSGLFDGLVAYYDMRGDANEIVGGNNGTVTGATLTTDRFGFSNGAYSFNGSSTYIDSGSNYSTVFSGLFSISVWCKCTNTSGATYGAILENQLNGGAGKEITFRQTTSTNQLYTHFYDGSTAFVGTFSATVQNWNHIVIVRDTLTTYKVFLNGNTTPVVSLSITNTDYTGPTNLFFGRYSTNQYFNGSIGEIQIFKSAKSSSEVKALYDLSSKDYLLSFL